MTQTIQGKFYPLQHSEWVRACKELTPAQRDVLYFIRTLDPYGSGLEVSIAEIARQLSTESKEVHRSTVSRAIKALEEKGFIDLELMQVRVKVLGKGVHCCLETTVLPRDNSVVSTQQARSPRNKRDHDATSVIMTQQARSPRNKRKPKASSNKGSGTSKINKINKTYLDFIKSLSDSERESFEEFARKKGSQLPKPPTLPEKWIAANHKELYEQFLASREGKEARKEAIASQHDWPNDPRYSTWLEKAFYEGMQWVEADEAEREQRWAFYQWVQYTQPSPFEGVYI